MRLLRFLFHFEVVAAAGLVGWQIYVRSSWLPPTIGLVAAVTLWLLFGTKAAVQEWLDSFWQLLNERIISYRSRLVITDSVLFAALLIASIFQNTARAFTLFALANLYMVRHHMVRHRLLPAGATCRR
jgi:hypothetical protein